MKLMAKNKNVMKCLEIMITYTFSSGTLNFDQVMDREKITYIIT